MYFTEIIFSDKKKVRKRVRKKVSKHILLILCMPLALTTFLSQPLCVCPTGPVHWTRDRDRTLGVHRWVSGLSSPSLSSPPPSPGPDPGPVGTRGSMEEGEGKKKDTRTRKHVGILGYTDGEYMEYLVHPEWTRKETDRMMEMAEQLDMRWMVIEDRFNTHEGLDETFNILN